MSEVSIVGLGNIGSALIPMVARIPEVMQVTLVDPDCYEEKNIADQSIDRSAVGLLKVEYQADRIRGLNPDIDVTTFAEPVENVPLLEMRSTLIIGCVDNRRARQAINQIACRLNHPWIDSAIGEPSLVRIALYHPASSAPCLECNWGPQAYEQLEQTYPCNPGESPAPATNAPAELGAFAASLLAAELRKRCNSDIATHRMPDGTQFMFDLATHTQSQMRYRYNPDCRFDHLHRQSLNIDLDPQATRLEELFEALDGDDPAIALEGHDFATHLDCSSCGRRRGVGLKLPRRLPGHELACSHCSERLLVPGFHVLPSLSRSELSPAIRALRLSAIGFRRGDVLSIRYRSGKSKHFALAPGGHDE